MKKLKEGDKINKTNNSQTLVLKDGKFHCVRWSNLAVGDIVMIHEDENIPADLVILRSSDNHGNAYIQTMTLDGERTLKQRYAFNEVVDKMKEEKIKLHNMKFYLKCGKPNNQIYQFDSDLQLKNPKMEKMNVTFDQFLLRGSKLANTDWIIGVIVYAGHDTKLLRSMSKSTIKQTHAEKVLNKIFLAILLTLQVLFAISLGTGGIIKYKTSLKYTTTNGVLDGPWYLWRDEVDYDQNTIWYFIVLTMRNFMLFGWILPIMSLVSIEIVKISQALFIIYDVKMFSVENDQGCKVFSMSLNEELGVINNIFTDKTGTLTANEMVLKACAIGDVKYDKEIIEEKLENPDEETDKILEFLHNELENNESELENIELYKKGSVKLAKQKDFIHYFWLSISLCHEVISISKNKQKLKKKHDDDLLIFHQDSSIMPKRKSTSKVSHSKISDDQNEGK